MGFAVFPRRPESVCGRIFLGKAFVRAKAAPKYLICDNDSIFWCEAFKRWCRRKGIHQTFGAVGQHGSIAVVERFIRTMKDEVTRRILAPLRRADSCRELALFFAWYNEHRPHRTLYGKTQNEVYFGLRPANDRPRLEPRDRWPRNAPCAGPSALLAGQAGDRFTLQVGFHDGRRYLPIVALKRAA